MKQKDLNKHYDEVNALIKRVDELERVIVLHVLDKQTNVHPHNEMLLRQAGITMTQAVGEYREITRRRSKESKNYHIISRG